MKEGVKMSENNKKINEQLDQAFKDSKPVSATDCTGLIQGLPCDEASASASTQMYDIAPSTNKKNDEKTQKERRHTNDRKR